MFQEKFLIIICGLPGTGKTTTAKKLSKHLSGYVVVGQNEIRRMQGIKKMRKTQDAVLREIDRQTAHYLNQGKGVIVDSVNRYLFRRHQMYGIASACGRRVITLEIVCSERAAKKRMRARTKGDGLVSDPRGTAVYDKLRKLWEDIMLDFKYPGEDHVSYIQFNTENKNLKQKIIQNNMNKATKMLEKILKC